MLTNNYPANHLEGITLSEGWKVIEKLNIVSTTSGKYSTCYLVEKNDQLGFLKAFDYRDLRKPGGKDKFSRLNEKFTREQNLLKECKNKGINTVVEFITSGEFYFKDGDINEKVDYFITEFSEDGNVKKCLKNADLNDLLRKFNSLIDIFDGINALHEHGIVHLDIKPSNLLYFVKDELTKITDFGSARQFIVNIDADKKDDLDAIITTRMYSPPEVLYNDPWTDDWTEYRKKIDLYLLGNILVKYFTNYSFTALLKQEITEFDSWDNNQNLGRFQQILPNLISAASNVYQIIFAQIVVINSNCGNPLDESYITRIMTMIQDLCNPDPINRGHKKELARKNNNHGLSRYRDSLIHMSKFIEVKLRREFAFDENNLK